jgi:hypothetical protein
VQRSFGRLAISPGAGCHADGLCVGMRRTLRLVRGVRLVAVWAHPDPGPTASRRKAVAMAPEPSRWRPRPMSPHPKKQIDRSRSVLCGPDTSSKRPINCGTLPAGRPAAVRRDGSLSRCRRIGPSKSPSSKIRGVLYDPEDAITSSHSVINSIIAMFSSAAVYRLHV